MTLKKSDGLEEWAARTALTLDDDTWSVLLRGSTVEWGPGKGDALLAELDRIAGELTPKARECLRLSLGEVPGEEWPYGPQAAALARKGLVQYAEHIDGPGGPRDWRRGYMCTPLGRAVLARTEGGRALPDGYDVAHEPDGAFDPVLVGPVYATEAEAVAACHRHRDRIKAEALREAAAGLPPDVCRWAIQELRARADKLDPPATPGETTDR